MHKKGCDWMHKEGAIECTREREGEWFDRKHKEDAIKCTRRV